jgi:nucleoid DNA-binding protein
MANDDKSKGKPLSKTAVSKELATKTGLETKQVGEVLDALELLIKQQLKGEPHVFALLDLVKFELTKKEAQKAGMKPNPFRPGEMMKVAAKPAETKVKARVLKGLKELESKKK